MQDQLFICDKRASIKNLAGHKIIKRKRKEFHMLLPRWPNQEAMIFNHFKEDRNCIIEPVISQSRKNGLKKNKKQRFQSNKKEIV